MTSTSASLERQRLDKWLWVARFFKTRSLAAEAIERGRVSVNGQRAKPARELKLNDQVEINQSPVVRTVVVLGLSPTRGGAPQAQGLYTETAESRTERERLSRERPYSVDPAKSLEHGRPTKRDRRELAQWDRWSASAPPDDDS